jgi:hypothetical protein
MASTIKVDNVEGQPGTNIINKCSTTITIGASSDTVALAAGASQTGFGRTGTVDWITTPKVTGDSPITGVTGKGYFLNTTAGTITLNLPAGAAGSIVSMADYAGTWQTNNVTVTPNGSEKIGGINANATLNTEGQSVTFVYVDAVQGWVNTMDSTSNVRGGLSIVATGGNQSPTCGLVSGDYKTHIFTGPGTFCVSQISSTTPENAVTYLVVAGGGGGGSDRFPASRIGGGAGAGGFRISNTTCLAVPKMSPLVAPAGQTVTASPYTITVGGGGTAGTGTAQPTVSGGRGNNSIFACITSTGGGGGAGHAPVCGGPVLEVPGGSGGGQQGPGACTGNQPPVSPAQGQDAGDGGCAPTYSGGGGGGAGGVGTNQSGGIGGSGGPGSFLDDDAIGPTAPSYGTPGPEPITRYFAGGGATTGPSPTAATGGAGGGGAVGGAGTINTGGGAGGLRGGTAGLGGSGIVIIRYKFQ